MNKRPVQPVFDEFELENLQTLMDIANGGTEKQGIRIAKTVIELVRSGSALSHALIIDAKIIDTNSSKRTLMAKKTPLNKGLLVEFGVEFSDESTDITEDTQLYLPAIDKTARFEPMHDPENEMYPQEVDGMRRLLRDDCGNKSTSGFIYTPTKALRGVIIGHEPEYLT